MNKNAKAFIVACESIYGSEAVVTRDNIAHVVTESGAPYPYWLVTKSDYRCGRGEYKVPASGETIKKSKVQPAYDTTTDESGALKIVRMNARDSTNELQELMVTYRKGKIELMQWTVIQRSWYMDRDLRISFQPRKGYGVQVKENAIWSSEKSYEIYIEINNTDFLTHGK